MLIDKTLLDSLTACAKESPRLRMNCDLRNSPEDHSQRQLNALEPGTIIPIHRHKCTSETIVVLRGKVLWKHYDNNGVETESFVIQANSDNCGITSPKISKSVTEITTAVNLLKTLSKKTGKASIAKLFIKSKVHKSQCLLDKTGKITLEASFSSSVPVFSLNSMVN